MESPPLGSPPPLLDALEARLDPPAAAWLRAALDEAGRGGAAGAGFARAWAAAGRKLGREALALPAAPGWAADEAGRALLLAAALETTPEAAHVTTAAELYRTGEERERQALVRALAHLPDPARFADLAAEAVRSNMQSVFEALACDNPYPARFMSDGAFGQLVLKALFVGVPLARVTGLDGRRTPELSRMVAAFASERRAAGRAVPDDVRMILEDDRMTSAPFPLCDPHIHMTSRTTDDYQAMAAAGIAVIVEPAFWVGQPRTHVGTFEDYFLSLVGWERFRASQFGIRHFCTLALNPKEANSPAVADGVLALLPRYLEKDGVVAVGEVGYDDQTDAEDRVFRAQVALAREHELPILIHTPHRDKKRGTERSLALVRELGFPPALTLVDHNTEETLPSVLAAGCWAGHSIYPQTKMDEARMVALVKQHGPERIIVNSAADWGVSDPLKVPKTLEAMRAAGVSDEALELIFWKNPLRFFAQSGRLDAALAAAPTAVDQRALWEGNSVLRGQTPRVDK